MNIFYISSIQFRELEKIGYRAVAYGFFENDVQAAYTTSCTCCVTPEIVNYIHAVTVAGINTYNVAIVKRICVPAK